MMRYTTQCISGSTMLLTLFIRKIIWKPRVLPCTCSHPPSFSSSHFLPEVTSDPFEIAGMKAGGFPYVVDYHSTLLEREARKMFLFPWRGQSPQLASRKQLVELISTTAEDIQLHCTTVHLAVFLIDVFMDHHVIAECHLQLFATTCLFTAAKYEEQDAHTPRLKDLMSKLDLGLPKQYFYCMELVLLKAVNWQLGFPSVASFLELYLQRTGLVAVGTEAFRTRAVDLANTSLDYPEFNTYKPSLVAAACLAAACQTFNVLPAWNEYLAECTGYTQSDLENCVESLLCCFQCEGKLKDTWMYRVTALRLWPNYM